MKRPNVSLCLPFSVAEQSVRKVISDAVVALNREDYCEANKLLGIAYSCTRELYGITVAFPDSDEDECDEEDEEE